MISGVVGWTVRTCTALKQILMLSTVIVFVQDKCNQMLLVTLILQADFFLEKKLTQITCGNSTPKLLVSE